MVSHTQEGAVPVCLFISGLSGAGKSTVSQALEDMGYFCVDNLPVSLAPQLIDILERGGRRRPTALVIDIREREFLPDFPELLSQIRARGIRAPLLFLESSDQVLLKRFSETRRRHPVFEAATLKESLAVERREMTPIRAIADLVIDTSSMTTHELRRKMIAEWVPSLAGGGMTLHLASFGFKYGLPESMDMLYDVRFLPNPHFVEALRPLGGDRPEVARFVLEASETMEYLRLTEEGLRFLVPRFRQEGKSYLTLAIGCTGGRHRSPAVAIELAGRLADLDAQIRVTHRDLYRAE